LRAEFVLVSTIALILRRIAQAIRLEGEGVSSTHGTLLRDADFVRSSG
jgi:hypothetical protein